MTPKLNKHRINSEIPLLTQGRANYSEPENLFRNWGGPLPTKAPEADQKLNLRS